MAEIMENNQCEHKQYASNSKANAGLTLGIIGTALSGLNILGELGSMSWNGCDNRNSRNNNCSSNANITKEELYLERKTAADELENTKARYNAYIDVTKEFYQGKIDTNEKMAQLFFDAYQRDVDNSFGLYKAQRDSKDELAAKIAEVDKKVDILTAVKPYENALITQKMDYNALQSEYQLSKRTARMIEGKLVLPTGVIGSTCPPFVPWPYPFPPFNPDTSVG